MFIVKSVSFQYFKCFYKLWIFLLGKTIFYSYHECI